MGECCGNCRYCRGSSLWGGYYCYLCGMPIDDLEDWCDHFANVNGY